eukprot:jgi/Hompol1/504/HPOL_005334-RA
MFVLSRLKDIVRVLPKDFTKGLTEAITEGLNQKYANKVLHNVGLCITVYHLEKVDDPLVHALTFEMIVFRPANSEVLEGRIKDSSSNLGVR